MEHLHSIDGLVRAVDSAIPALGCSYRWWPNEVAGGGIYTFGTLTYCMGQAIPTNKKKLFIDRS
jgi:hypothetical protein